MSCVPLQDLSGQSVFEKELIQGLCSIIDSEQPHFLVRFFTVDAPQEMLGPSIFSLPFYGKTYPQHLAMQWRLFWSLGWQLFLARKKKVHMFLRYHPSMIAPLLLSFLFPLSLTIRTGPVLPNLFIYKKNPPWIIYQGIKIILKLLYTRAQTIIVATSKIQEWVCTTFNISKSKCQIVSNAANIQIFYPSEPNRQAWKLPDRGLVLGYVGSLYHDQGMHIVIEAFHQLKQKAQNLPTLLIVGGGEDLESLQKKTVQYGLTTRIIFAGKVDHAEVPSAINSCDWMLAPFTKRAFEVTGSSALKLYEYLACDKPVIASMGEDHLFIEREKLGILVPPEDVERWVEAIQSLSRGDFLELQSGYSYVQKNHTYTAVASRILGLTLNMESH